MITFHLWWCLFWFFPPQKCFSCFGQNSCFCLLIRSDRFGVRWSWGAAGALPAVPRPLPAGGPHQQPCAGVAALRALSAGRAFEPAPLPRHWPARARGGQPAVGAAGGAP